MPERLIVLQPITDEILQYRKHRHRSTVIIGHLTILNSKQFQNILRIILHKIRYFLFLCMESQNQFKRF